MHITRKFSIIIEINMNKVRADHAGMPSLLIVDDDPVVVELVGLYAREAGFGSVVGAGTADEGLRAFRNGQFRLVFLDLGLPDRPDGDALREFMVAAGSKIGRAHV